MDKSCSYWDSSHLPQFLFFKHLGGANHPQKLHTNLMHCSHRRTNKTTLLYGIKRCTHNNHVPTLPRCACVASVAVQHPALPRDVEDGDYHLWTVTKLLSLTNQVLVIITSWWQREFWNNYRPHHHHPMLKMKTKQLILHDKKWKRIL